MLKRYLLSTLLLSSLVMSGASVVTAQELLPTDNGLSTYHTTPRYRESESHPLRVISYVVHPVGWLLREVIFRPFSYFASSTEVTRSVMGYREPFDYRQPECFSADDSVPDCRSIAPFNYDQVTETPEATVDNSATSSISGGDVRQVYFPNVNFDFNNKSLNSLGQGRAKQIGEMLQKDPGVKVVLQGHADYIGSEAYNMKLGMDRAEAVRSELVRLGISADRLSTVSFGESQPLFQEKEDWARALNRRVEVHSGEETVEAAPAAAE